MPPEGEVETRGEAIFRERSWAACSWLKVKDVLETMRGLEASKGVATVVLLILLVAVLLLTEIPSSLDSVKF